MYLRQEVIKKIWGGRSNVKMFLETTMVTQLPFDDTHRTHINAELSVFELKAQMKTEPLKFLRVAIRLLWNYGYYNLL